MNRHLYHYWIAYTGPALCVKAGDKSRADLFCFEGPPCIHITVEKSIVTCRDCLELIHA